MNKFSNRLEILIKENKTKKKDLAAEVGLSPSMITDMVKGRGNPSLRTIRSIANYYHVSEEWLEYGTGEIMEPLYNVAKIHEGLTPKEAEALRIMRECPEALSVVQMMGAMDRDTQKNVQLSVEKEKLFRELIKERQEKGAA